MFLRMFMIMISCMTRKHDFTIKIYHSHCGLKPYVIDTFRSDEVHIDQITTCWEQLTVEISHNTPGAKNI